jgi:hypothetical protein
MDGSSNFFTGPCIPTGTSLIYGYYNNRIEREARDFENAYVQNCLKDLCKNGIIHKVM